MKIVWTTQARREVLDIIAYVARFDPVAAQALLARLDAVVLPLAEHPYLCRPGRVAGTREMVDSPNYIIVYQVADTIQIVSVVHTRRRYP